MSKKTLFLEWTKQPMWHGNPELGYDSWCKHFKNPFNGKMTPVYVFGNSDTISFCVSAGANSDYSYSGCFYPEKLNFPEFMARVDECYNQGKLFR